MKTKICSNCISYVPIDGRVYCSSKRTFINNDEVCENYFSRQQVEGIKKHADIDKAKKLKEKKERNQAISNRQLDEKDIALVVEFFKVIVKEVENFTQLFGDQYISNQDEIMKFMRMIGVKGKEHKLRNDIRILFNMKNNSSYPGMSFIKTDIFQKMYFYLEVHKHKNFKDKLHKDIVDRLTPKTKN